MKISLRKANALQNNIAEAVKQIVVKDEISLTEFHNAEQEIAQAQAEALANVTRRDELLSAQYHIRQAVGRVNHNVEITATLAQLAELEKRIQFYTALAAKTPREGTEIIAGRLDKLRIADTKSRIYGYGDTVSTGVFTSEQLAEFRRTATDLRKQKQKLQDRMLETNVRVEIELSQPVVELLQREGLV